MVKRTDQAYNRQQILSLAKSYRECDFLEHEKLVLAPFSCLDAGSYIALKDIIQGDFRTLSTLIGTENTLLLFIWPCGVYAFMCVPAESISESCLALDYIENSFSSGGEIHHLLVGRVGKKGFEPEGLPDSVLVELFEKYSQISPVSSLMAWDGEKGYQS